MSAAGGLFPSFPAPEPAKGRDRAEPGRAGQLLTQDVLLVLRDQRGPVLLVRVLDVDVDEAVARRVQVGAEREHAALVGHVGVLRLEVVHQPDPRQQTCRTRTFSQPHSRKWPQPAPKLPTTQQGPQAELEFHQLHTENPTEPTEPLQNPASEATAAEHHHKDFYQD